MFADSASRLVLVIATTLAIAGCSGSALRTKTKKTRGRLLDLGSKGDLPADNNPVYHDAAADDGFFPADANPGNICPRPRRRQPRDFAYEPPTPIRTRTLSAGTALVPTLRSCPRMRVWTPTSSNETPTRRQPTGVASQTETARRCARGRSGSAACCRLHPRWEVGLAWRSVT